jgi:hypothetical protein
MAEQPSAEPLRPRQFTLSGLMSFMIGWSAYFSMIGGLMRLMGDDRSWRRHEWLLIVCTVAGCWTVLWFLYRRWGLRHALRVHYAGPIIFTPLSFLLLLLAGFDRPPVADFLLLPPAAALYGCCMSVLFGFPIAAIMLLFVDPSQGVQSASPSPHCHRGVPSG